MIRIFFIFLLSIMNLQTAAREDFNLHKDIEPQIGYTGGVRVGDTLYISGTTGSGETMAEQLKETYERIDSVLKNYKADFSNVVKETVFVTDMEAMVANNAVRKAFYDRDGKNTYPASSWIGIERLYHPSLMVEVELIVYLGKEN